MLDKPQTDLGQYFIFKVFAPCLLIFTVLVLMLGGPMTERVLLARSIIGVPLILYGLFLFTLAEVKLTQRTLTFRRFRKWTQVHYTQIRRCSKSLVFSIAFFSLDGRAAPWLRIYFVTRNPIDRENDLVKYINRQLTHSISDVAIPIEPRSSVARNKRILMAFALAGFAVGLIQGIRSHNLAASSLANFPRPIVIAETILMHASMWPWNFLIGVTFLFLALVGASESRAKPCIFVSGLALGLLVGQVLR
jgi:hypothetical protein